jgi:hypothetical protein
MVDFGVFFGCGRCRPWGLSEWLLWIRAVLDLVTAGLSLWSLVTNYSRLGTDSSDLHFRWTQLANDYEALWQDMYSSRSAEKLAELRRRG